MKIAVTYDNGQVWQHFGRTENFKFYDVEDGTVVSSEVVNTEGAGHGALVDFLASHGANAVIMGGAGAPIIMMLNSLGIKTYPGVTGEADAAVDALLAGTLETNEDAVHEGCHHHAE
ncbi:MAG: NifB/NifX family molybdenum-iron cluster-binding protein [Lachnospiraceae bacterium]|nr:NifB/NifX family molybdenum-iron cluster-binding protein [Lachnospiraceae bacterium]